MKPIGEALIEHACQEVAEFDASTLASQMEALGQSQPNLLAFVMSTCEELSPETAELGVYLFFVVYRIFERAAGTKLEEVSEKRILAAEEHTDELLDAMEDAEEGFLEGVVEADFSTQPEIIHYIAELLATYGEDEDEAKLAGEEKWLLFSVLNTVVDVLDELV